MLATNTKFYKTEVLILSLRYKVEPVETVAKPNPPSTYFDRLNMTKADIFYDASLSI